jgi:predicted RNA-binding Zn ribbon-like protein
MPAKFRLFADHPTLDFVNTLDDRFLASGTIEMLHDYEDLLAFGQQSGLLDAASIKALKVRASDAAARRVLTSALEVREALACVFYGPLSGPDKDASDALRGTQRDALQVLQRQYSAALEHQRLAPQRGLSKTGSIAGATWVWKSPEPRVELPVWLITQSAISLLTSTAMEHVHACASERCRWLFLDTSKNHSRRWCDMTICGNRMKAHRFHARHEAK